VVVARRVRWPVRLIPARREGAKAHGCGSAGAAAPPCTLALLKAVKTSPPCTPALLE